MRAIIQLVHMLWQK